MNTYTFTEKITSLISREELLGVSRGKNAKDVDWATVAGGELEEEVVEKPTPVKISPSEVVRVRKPHKKLISKSSGAVNKNSRN